MTLPTTYKGSTYVEAWTALRDAAGRENGLEALAEMPDPLTGGFVPRLSNGQAVALVQAWRRAAARGQVTWPVWADLASYALGRIEGTERFDMSQAHARAPLDAAGLALVWSATAELASDLDAGGTIVRPLVVTWTRGTYEQAARDAWETIKRERAEAESAARVPGPLLPPPQPNPDDPPKVPGGGRLVDIIADPLRPVRRAAFNAALAALLLGALALWAVRAK